MKRRFDPLEAKLRKELKMKLLALLLTLRDVEAVQAVHHLGGRGGDDHVTQVWLVLG